VWPTLPKLRICYIANITDHGDIGVVWWDQNTFSSRKDVSSQNNEKITTPPHDERTYDKEIYPSEKPLLWMV